jgi:hypothetical protein
MLRATIHGGARNCARSSCDVSECARLGPRSWGYISVHRARSSIGSIGSIGVAHHVTRSEPPTRAAYSITRDIRSAGIDLGGGLWLRWDGSHGGMIRIRRVRTRAWIDCARLHTVVIERHPVTCGARGVTEPSA